MVNTFLSWLHQADPQPILFTIGRWQVHWYGLLLAVAIVAAWLIIRQLAKQRSFDVNKWDNMLFASLWGGLIGARLYHVILEWPYYWQQPIDIIKIWQGGIAIHGAWLGSVVVIGYYAWHYRWSLFSILDIMVLGVIIGQAIGRWGNWFNQELFGLPTNLPWGIYISPAYRLENFTNFDYFHPTFLYESLLNIVLAIILWQIYRHWRDNKGLVLSVYIVGYSIIRWSLEWLRIDRTPDLWSWRWPQWFSLLAILAVLLYWLIRVALPKIKKSV